MVKLSHRKSGTVCIWNHVCVYVCVCKCICVYVHTCAYAADVWYYNENRQMNNIRQFNVSFFIKILFIFREREREGEKDGEKHRYARDTSMGCLSHAPNLGPGLQPQHVAWLGIKPVTFWFTGQYSICWATPARDNVFLVRNECVLISFLKLNKYFWNLTFVFS